jgi:hypothetical protein
MATRFSPANVSVKAAIFNAFPPFFRARPASRSAAHLFSLAIAPSATAFAILTKLSPDLTDYCAQKRVNFQCGNLPKPCAIVKKQAACAKAKGYSHD